MYYIDTKGQSITNNRELVYNYIETYPGSHLRKISKELSLGVGDIQHHLNFLEKSGIIRSRRMNTYKVYYVVSILEERQESILAILRQETPRTILLFLIENPGASQGEIAKHLSFAPPTINWHMTRLMELGLVYSRKDGRFVKYNIKGDLKEITALLRSFYPTIWDKLSIRLVDLFLDLSASTLPDEKSDDNVL